MFVCYVQTKQLIKHNNSVFVCVFVHMYDSKLIIMSINNFLTFHKIQHVEMLVAPKEKNKSQNVKLSKKLLISIIFRLI